MVMHASSCIDALEIEWGPTGETLVHCGEISPLGVASKCADNYICVH